MAQIEAWDAHGPSPIEADDSPRFLACSCHSHDSVKGIDGDQTSKRSVGKVHSIMTDPLAEKGEQRGLQLSMCAPDDSQFQSQNKNYGATHANRFALYFLQNTIHITLRHTLTIFEVDRSIAGGHSPRQPLTSTTGNLPKVRGQEKRIAGSLSSGNSDGRNRNSCFGFGLDDGTSWEGGTHAAQHPCIRRPRRTPHTSRPPRCKRSLHQSRLLTLRNFLFSRPRNPP